MALKKWVSSQQNFFPPVSTWLPIKHDEDGPFIWFHEFIHSLTGRFKCHQYLLPSACTSLFDVFLFRSLVYHQSLTLQMHWNLSRNQQNKQKPSYNKFMATLIERAKKNPRWHSHSTSSFHQIYFHLQTHRFCHVKVESSPEPTEIGFPFLFSYEQNANWMTHQNERIQKKR